MDETIPKLVWFTHSATHDHVLLKKLKMGSNTIYVLDKGTLIIKFFGSLAIMKPDLLP